MQFSEPFGGEFGASPDFDGLTSANDVSSFAAGPVVLLSWPQARGDADAVYEIYISSTSYGYDFGNPTIVTAAGVTSYPVTGLVAGNTYYILVLARGSDGAIDNNMLERSTGVAVLVHPGYQEAPVSLGNRNLWRRTPSFKPSKSVGGRGFRIRARSR